ncbi:hypothetical protein L202_05156 [Cryptococcus amylolentus CBS 6039]|uniref:Transmembrane protein n=1 Tax=Cryptococcus amylolentus CBS 6039 TaxID=1295533 RepID=A0A1E3HJG1_9TREE|nr:hypothetical protein L202_05156 [Cryptococcus amylolentus CBS 6039]ODN76490.1 hypothetical protein L202_05156 [Cryptococcus amylolentus CBS 6039]
MSDKQSLLPTHINHSTSSRLSTPRISFPSSSHSSKSLSSSESQDTIRPGVGGKALDLSGRSLASEGEEDDEEVVGEGLRTGKRPGLPKVSRECLISEIKCYGSYMLPPFLIFGVLAIGLCLFFVGLKSGWFE